MEQDAVSILAEPGFIPTELASVQDALRVANQTGQEARHGVRVCTRDEIGLLDGAKFKARTSLRPLEAPVRKRRRPPESQLDPLRSGALAGRPRPQSRICP